MISGYALIVLHIAKYVPQFQRNTERRSTVGLSPRAVTLEFLGSFFCLLQLIMDLVNET